jgi:hypothetical protein
MTMLQGYAHMVDFFTRFDWWRTEPHDELVSKGAYCLANPGETYVAYLPHGSRVTLRLKTGRYSASWFNPSTGRTSALPSVAGGTWASPEAPNTSDWALLLQVQKKPQ